ncbi:hypothetical protein [Desulfosarcina ovata]|uniref:Uncharacterized protein n=1 Tax=Desulfosarcina ovata subsp. ovata TaxID=2752305 RepID=A0A5K8ABJ7_9BACT|nr:hypothetical protein [Desulfosarcina ovata]BBO89985.1 hypothetical protein DSCOOX_31650 [Desulfosarcina ovata subsp. ovata]
MWDAGRRGIGTIPASGLGLRDTYVAFDDGATLDLAGGWIAFSTDTYMKTRIGGERIVDMLTGEQLPRIC